MWSLVVPVHVKSLPQVKFIQIFLKITSIVHRKLYRPIICTNSYDTMHDSGDTAD